MISKVINKVLFFVGVSVFLTSCYDPTQKADPDATSDHPGYEYAPQMYHSIPYDALTQTEDRGTRVNDSLMMEEEGWVYRYNTNYYNKNNINSRQPAPGTVTTDGVAAWEFGSASDEDYIAAGEAYPYVEPQFFDIDSTEDVDPVTYKKMITPKGERQFAKCEELYGRFCAHCHGDELDGAGPVSSTHEPEAGPYSGIANLIGKKDYGAGRIYSIITHGYNRMGSHASQLSPKERWMIVTYVKYKQNQ